MKTRDLLMTNLNKIMEFLDGEVIYKKIDEPLDEALRKFSDKISAEITQKEFNSIIRSFIEHLQNCGVMIYTTQATANESSEIIWLTEKYYQGHETKGYEGALYDATTQGKEGIESVLEGIVEKIKSDERGKYVSCIIAKYFTFLDWDTKKEIVTEIFNEYSHILPSQLEKSQIPQLVPSIEGLLNIIIKTNQTLFRILNRHQTETI